MFGSHKSALQLKAGKFNGFWCVCDLIKSGVFPLIEQLQGWGLGRVMKIWTLLVTRCELAMSIVLETSQVNKMHQHRNEMFSGI